MTPSKRGKSAKHQIDGGERSPVEQPAAMTPDQVRGRLWAQRLKREFNIAISICDAHLFGGHQTHLEYEILVDCMPSVKPEGMLQKKSLTEQLSNILLTDLDREPGRRGRRFGHYANDCGVSDNRVVQILSSGGVGGGLELTHPLPDRAATLARRRTSPPTTTSAISPASAHFQKPQPNDLGL